MANEVFVIGLAVLTLVAAIVFAVSATGRSNRPDERSNDRSKD